jgi:hypothetical protein
MLTPEQKKNNARLAWVLATVALTFFFGFMLKMAWLRH